MDFLGNLERFEMEIRWKRYRYARIINVSYKTAFRRTSGEWIALSRGIRVKRDYDELLRASRSRRGIQERTSINVGWFGTVRERPSEKLRFPVSRNLCMT